MYQRACPPIGVFPEGCGVSVADIAGLGTFVVMCLFLILGWRAGKRQFRAWSQFQRDQGRQEFAAELAAFAAGGAASASQQVTVVQGGYGNGDQPHAAGRASGRVLDGLPADVSHVDSETVELARIVRRYNLDPASLPGVGVEVAELLASGVPLELER